MQTRESRSAAAGRYAAATGLAVAACFSLPALAAAPHKILCSESEEAHLEVPVETLAAEIVHLDSTDIEVRDIPPLHHDIAHTESTILEPLAEAAIRDAFSDDERPDSTTANHAEQAPASVMNAELPGVSRERQIRFRKRMYRRDI